MAEPEQRSGGPTAVGPRRRSLPARAVSAVGRLLITTGLVVLLLAAYQLWGTSLQTNRSQGDLADQFQERLTEGGRNGVESDGDGTTRPSTSPATPSTPGSPSTSRAPSTAPPKPAPAIAPPRNGDAIGTLTIPSIGLDGFYFVQGVGVAELKRGAGHYPQTPLPGQRGNAAIAGHRTTYGAPLHNVDDLVTGAEIVVRTVQGEFRYRVAEISIVKPDEVSVLEDKGDDRLTLTACHPQFGASERIIVAATLVGNPVPELPGQDASAAEDIAAAEVDGANVIDDFATEPALAFPGAFWGLACLGLWLVVRLLAWQGRRSGRFSRWIPYALGTPACGVLLYLFFESFSYEGAARSLGIG